MTNYCIPVEVKKPREFTSTLGFWAVKTRRYGRPFSERELPQAITSACGVEIEVEIASAWFDHTAHIVKKCIINHLSFLTALKYKISRKTIH